MGDYIQLADSGGASFDALLARPEKPNGAAVVVLQEIFGINDNIRSVAREFAAQGYLAIAPDLFWRQQRKVDLDPASEQDRERAMALMAGLDVPQAIQDALTAARYVGGQPGIAGRTGCVGYCLGGKLAFLLASHAEIKSAVAYYGTGIHTVLGGVAGIVAPTLLHIAEADHLCPADARAEILGAITDQPLISVIVYPGVGHAFARRGGATFDATSADRANAATILQFERDLLE